MTLRINASARIRPVESAGLCAHEVPLSMGAALQLGRLSDIRRKAAVEPESVCTTATDQKQPFEAHPGFEGFLTFPAICDG